MTMKKVASAFSNTEKSEALTSSGSGKTEPPEAGKSLFKDVSQIFHVFLVNNDNTTTTTTTTTTNNNIIILIIYLITIYYDNN